MTDLALFFGSFHPLIVHMPIGAAVIALFFQLAARFEWGRGLAPAVPWLFGFAALGAIGSVMSGWALAGAPGETSWDDHRWFGVGTAVALVVATGLTFRSGTPKWSLVNTGFGVLCMGLIGWTGHLGGALTHGEEHFAQYAPEPLRETVLATSFTVDAAEREVEPADRDNMNAYAGLIQPMFDEHCVDCHRAGLTHGNLRLDSYAALKKGGSEGDARGLKGELWRRVTLNPEHPRYMPSRGTPFSYDQLAILHDWLAAGLDSTATVGEVEWTDKAYKGAEHVYALNIRELPYIDRARPAAIEVPEDLQHWQVVPISQKNTTYTAHLRQDADDPAAALAELEKVASNVVILDLRRLRNADAFLRKLPDMPHLTEIDLSRSDVTAAGVSTLDRYEHLEQRQLFGTAAAEGTVL